MKKNIVTLFTFCYKGIALNGAKWYLVTICYKAVAIIMECVSKSLTGNAGTETVVCLMGATAVGKTELAVKLVNTGNFEIISVDSAQIYQQMDIGTAKPDAKTLELAPHRLIDFVDPALSYSVAQFCADAKREINTILANNKTPLLVGGTMMYFNALQTGLSKLPQSNAKIRQQIYNKINSLGLNAVYQELKDIDPIVASKIHPNDSQRIIRALEVFKISGIPLSELQNQKQKPDFNFKNFKLMPADREQLKLIIAQRFEKMLDQGLIFEVSKLFERKDLNSNMPSIKCVGYRQVWQYLNNEIDFEQMRQKAIIATRQLAKRQLTWLRSMPGTVVTTDYELVNELNNAL